MTVTGRDSKRLGSAIQAVRERLGVTQEEFAVLCGLSLMTIQRVESGKVKPRAKTFGGLDAGAGWATGSARTLLVEGREPVVLRQVETADDVYERELRDEVEREMFLITELSEDARWASIVRRRKRIAAEYAASQGLGRTGR